MKLERGILLIMIDSSKSEEEVLRSASVTPQTYFLFPLLFPNRNRESSSFVMPERFYQASRYF
jgi:hypothetical protein